VEVDPERGNWAEGLATYLADYLYQEERVRRNIQEGASHRVPELRKQGERVPSLPFQGKDRLPLKSNRV